MTEDTKLRLFTALELPEEWRRVLARLRAEIEKVDGGELKWVRPELMHLTLVFLGYQQPGSLSTIQASLASAGAEVPPFDLTLGRIGRFGPPHSLHVIWVGLAELPTELERLHDALAAHLSAGGIPFDRKPLVPHITLARGRRPIDRAVSLRVHSALQKVRIPDGLTTRVGDFVLMRSHLSRLGPDYEVAARFALGGSDAR